MHFSRHLQAFTAQIHCQRVTQVFNFTFELFYRQLFEFLLLNLTIYLNRFNSVLSKLQTTEELMIAPRDEFSVKLDVISYTL